MEEALWVDADGERIFVRALGHITAAHCPELKTRCFARLDKPAPVLAILLDLSACEYMDSTFLGLIVGLTKRIMAKSGKKLSIIGVNEACLSLLRTIGVLGLVELLPASPLPFPPSLERVGRGVVATAEFLLDAHEELSNLSQENRAKFNALTSMLKESLRSPEGSEGKR